MSSERDLAADLERFVRSLYDAFGRGEVDALAEALAPPRGSSTSAPAAGAVAPKPCSR